MKVSSSSSRLRADVREADALIRRQVLAGAFNADTAAACRWKAPTWKLLPFLSSPFTDTREERKYLVDELQFYLRNIGHQHGIQVIFVDMRWGIQDQNTRDHKTWEECVKAIEWCKLESMGIVFLSLQGNKYGYTPLPKSVDEADLQQHLTLRECSEEDRELIFTWYKLDDNSTPKKYYLKNLKSTDDPEYFRDFEKLLSLLIDLPFDKSYEGLQVGRSVTEWEIRAALDTFPCQLNRDDDICWSFRNFSGEIDDKMFCDINENERGEKYWNDLISFMKSQIPQSSMEVYSADLTLLDMRNRTNKYDMYVDQFRKFTKAKMEASLQSVVDCRQQWAKDGNGVGIPGLKLAEMLHHCTFAKEKCTTFIGRHNLINTVLDVIQAPHREVEGNLDPFNPIHQFLGICVSIVGASGAGKTALMAKVASETFLQKSDDAVVVIRFCGTSPESMNARRLMLSISAQVEYLFDVAEKKVDLLFDEKYDKVVEYFQLLLRTYPVMLFIDSLDQLTDENQGRSQISFLKGVRPHPKTRIIVSCLPDDQVESAETGLKYVYLCETRLKSAHVPRVDVRMTTESALEESTEIIDTLLKRKGRTLQPHQREMVRLRISETKELTALHISLLARVLSKWTGEVDADVLLQGGVVKLIEDFFNALQNEFGRDMTRMALAILTFSKKGISDIELEDILSSCDEVLDKVFQYATPSIRRLPSHVWLRLKASMTGLITEGEDNCMHWYHRQIKETAERTFHLEKATAHSLMGRYFGNLLESSLRDTRKIIGQHWTYSGNPLEESSEVNVRRCREATYHMIESGLIEEAARELCNFEGICCKIRCGEGFQLLRDFSSVIHALDSFYGSATVSKKRLHHYYWWLRRDMHYLSGNCLLRFSVSASSQPKLSDVRKDINALSFFPFKAYTLGGSDNFDPLQVELAGHTHNINALAYCQGGDVLASGSSDGTVLLWDLSTGEVKSKLECCACMVKSVAWSPDGKLLAAGCGDKIIRLWDASRGEEIAKFVGHNSWVKSIVFSKDGKLLVSGSGDENILLWDVATSMKIGMLEGHSKAVNSVDFDPTGSILASGSDDNTVKLWDMPSGNVRFNFVGHSDKVNCVAFCADGKTLASGSYDHAIYLWDVDTETQKFKLLGHRLAILSLAFSPHGEILVSVSHDKTIRVWSVNNGETLATLEGHVHSINSVTFSPDGKNSHLRLMTNIFDCGMCPLRSRMLAVQAIVME